MSVDLIQAHYDQYLASDNARIEVEPVGSVRILHYSTPSLGFNTFVTLGLSEVDLSAVYPQELVCSILPGQDGAADFLVRRCVQMILQRGQGFTIDDIIPNSQPLLVNTNIYGVLTGGHPYLPEEFDVVHGRTQDVVATLITLIPITNDEILIAQRGQVDDLLTALEEGQSSLLDITRPSVTG